MAASNDRIVSKGRSKRGRVGFDRSGSARRKQGLAKQAQERKMSANELMTFPN